MTQNKLPVFAAGNPLANELASEKLNAFVAYVKSITPIAGNGLMVKQTADGTVIDMLAGQYVVGAYDNPYILASCHFASFVTTATGGGGTYGGWGGVSDAATATYGNIPAGFSAESMQVDEWHRERNPNQPYATTGFEKGELTRGVYGPLVRAYDGYYSISTVSTGGFATGTKTFIPLNLGGGPVFGFGQRTPLFDLRGVLVSLSPEIQMGIGYGAFQYEYKLGSCRYASSISGPNGATGPWGGTADAITAGFVNGAYVDQWSRYRAPLDPLSNAQSFGVTGPFVRVVSGLSLWSPGVSAYVFTSPSGPINRLYARSAQHDCRGMLLSIGEEELINDVGVIQNPYILGGQKYGSSMDGSPAITLGPWGGVSDGIAGVATDSAFQDEWHRDRPPSNTAGVQTFGVTGSLFRSVGGVSNSPTNGYVYNIYTRSLSFDARGSLVFISKEVKTTITGSLGTSPP